MREEHVFSSSVELLKELNKVCLLLVLAICVLKKKKIKKEIKKDLVFLAWLI